MRNTILAFTLFLASCGGSSANQVDTAQAALAATREASVALFQAVSTLCDLREREVVDRTGTTKEQDVADITRIREECGKVMKPLLDVIGGVEVVETVIDVPWIREAL